MKIYLDYNATTPIAPAVSDAISSAAVTSWMNPSSNYAEAARSTIAESRMRMAKLLNVLPHDLIFTSGGTEANYTVFHTISKFPAKERPQVITSNIEHPSVLLPLTRMSEEKLIDLTIINVEPHTGVVNPKTVVDAIRVNRVVLVSVMLANNETGAIMPIEQIATAIKHLRNCKASYENVYLHSDIAQAVGKIPVDLQKIGLDYATIVGHKFYGPRIGCLYVRNAHLIHKSTEANHSATSCEATEEVPLIPLFVGGAQEFGFRAGTENTPMIAGLGMAAQLVIDNLDKYVEHMLNIRRQLEEELHAAFSPSRSNQIRVCIFGLDRCAFTEPDIPNGHPSPSLRCLYHRLPNTVNVTFSGSVHLDSRDILARCPQLQASRGAACHSEIQDSNVLRSCGYSAEEARSAIRLSIGRDTTPNEITAAVNAIKSAIESLVHQSKPR